MNNDYLKGLKDGIPIALGYFAVSAAYGMAAIIQGLTVSQAVITSLSNLTSAGQFAGTALLAVGANLIELIVTQLVINARYFLMSISLSQKLSSSVNIWQRLAIAYGVTDEIYAVAIGQKSQIGFKYCMGLITLPVIGWTMGTLCGASASSILPADLVNALGLAMYGMFIAIFVPQMKHSRAVTLCVLIAVGCSCLFTFVPGLNQLSSGYTVIISALIAAGVCAALFPIKENEEMAKEDDQ